MREKVISEPHFDNQNEQSWSQRILFD
jgi:hypothetical protein